MKINFKEEMDRAKSTIEDSKNYEKSSSKQNEDGAGRDPATPLV